MDILYSLKPLLAVLDEFNHSELHVHHTCSPSHKDFNGTNYQKLQDNMRAYHIRERGWKDIGQHLTLFPDGNFLTGRPFKQIPASIKGFNGTVNKIPLAVEMLGNFNVGQDAFEGKQRDAILGLAKWFHDKGRYVRFHRENAATDCPGTLLDKDKFMDAVMAYGVPTFTDVRGHWAESYIYDVAGVMQGYGDGTFRPDRPVTRAELAVVLSKIK